MRINLHDYSGHPFQAQLARSLAERGHEVVHSYSQQYVTGHGRLERQSGDAPGLSFQPIVAAAPMKKYSPIGRTRFELSYAKAYRQLLAADDFDLVVACNIPLFALDRIRRQFARTGQPWVLWHQDIYSFGVADEAARRMPRAAAEVIRRSVHRMERQQLLDADAVICIGDEFVDQYDRWRLPTDHVEVIPNWAPIDDVTPGWRENPWSRQQGLRSDALRLMYAGTLGRKHNPLLLLDLLDQARQVGLEVEMIVCSEGAGADVLAQAADGRPDLRILGFQPAADFGHVLSSADVVVALLETDAAAFSVPSKVHSYMSAGRPTVALVPEGNPSAREVQCAGGFVGPPTPAGAEAAAAWLKAVTEDPGALSRLGECARALAVERFDIESITDRFESVFLDVAGRGVRSTTARADVFGERAA